MEVKLPRQQGTLLVPLTSEPSTPPPSPLPCPRLSGESPFQGDGDADTLARVTTASYEFDEESFEDISEQAKEFIRSLLQKDMRSVPRRFLNSKKWKKGLINYSSYCRAGDLSLGIQVRLKSRK